MSRAAEAPAPAIDIAELRHGHDDGATSRVAQWWNGRP